MARLGLHKHGAVPLRTRPSRGCSPQGRCWAWQYTRATGSLVQARVAICKIPGSGASVAYQSKARHGAYKGAAILCRDAAQLPQALEAGMQVPHSRLRKQLRAEPTRHVALRASSAVADGPAPARAGQPPVRGSQGLTGTGPGVPRLEPCQVRSLRRGCRLRLSGTSAACKRAAGGAGRAAHASAPAPSTALSLGGRVRRSPVDDPRPRRRLDARRVRLGLHAVRRSVRLVSAKAPLQVLRTHLLQCVLLSSV